MLFFLPELSALGSAWSTKTLVSFTILLVSFTLWFSFTSPMLQCLSFRHCRTVLIEHFLFYFFTFENISINFTFCKTILKQNLNFWPKLPARAFFRYSGPDSQLVQIKVALLKTIKLCWFMVAEELAHFFLMVKARCVIASPLDIYARVPDRWVRERESRDSFCIYECGIMSKPDDSRFTVMKASPLHFSHPYGEKNLLLPF